MLNFTEAQGKKNVKEKSFPKSPFFKTTSYVDKKISLRASHGLSILFVHRFPPQGKVSSKCTPSKN